VRIGLFAECAPPSINGIVVALEALRAGLRAYGHEVLMVAPSGRVDARLPSCPLPTTRDYRLVLPWVFPSVLRAMGSLDIIHSHSMFGVGDVAYRIARMQGIPYVQTYHTRLESYLHYVPLPRAVLRGYLHARIRHCFRRADSVLVPTQAIADQLRDAAATTPLVVAPNGIMLETFFAVADRGAIRTRYGIGVTERIALCVSRLGREKSLEQIIRAFAQAPTDMRLVLVGDGPERLALEALAEQEGIASRILFLGRIAPSQIAEVYTAADLFLFASRSETQGLVLVEALAAGLPILAVDTSVTREVLQGSDAQFVTDGVAALGNALRACSFVRDPSTIAARRRIAQRLDYRVTSRHCLSLYDALLGGRRVDGE